MDLSSPPTSARSHNSIASDLIHEDRPALTESFVRRRGSGTSVHSAGEDYMMMDMVLENFFGLHNEIGDIENSLTADSPKESPRVEEYSSSTQHHQPASTQPLYPPPVPHEHVGFSQVNAKESHPRHSFVPTPLSMNLVSSATGGILQLAPATLESKMQLKALHDSQQELFQKNCLMRKKIITMQVSMAIFEEDPMEAGHDIRSNDVISSTVVPPPMQSNMSSKKFQKSCAPSPLRKVSQGGKAKSSTKEKTKDKEKSKRSNLMRHIYKTNCNAFRVQISVGSKVNPNGKFSRNTRLEKDALWLCELAILFIHRPSSPEYLFHWGNYEYLLEYGHCSSYEDYVSTLMKQFVELTGRGLIKPHEFDILKNVMTDFFPSLRENLVSLDITEIVLEGKKNKKSSAYTSKSKNSGNVNVGAPTKSKVAVPVLQLPASSGNDPLVSQAFANQTRVPDANRTVGVQGMMSFTQGSNASLKKPVYGDGSSVQIRNNDVDRPIMRTEENVKRRRVPADNPDHQSPRTLELLQKQINDIKEI